MTDAYDALAEGKWAELVLRVQLKEITLAEADEKFGVWKSLFGEEES